MFCLGDMLVHINGQEVTWSNLLHLVQTVKKEVKAYFKKKFDLLMNVQLLEILFSFLCSLVKLD